MTARDYKHARRRPSTPPPRQGSWLSFISGLGVGLLVAFGVYLWAGQLPPPATMVDDLRGRFRTDEPVLAATPEIEPVPELPEPKFDFYKILPEMEVPIPEWELGADKADAERAAAAELAPGLAPGTYVLQVGSFKRFEDADRAKATLALRGIAASIQRVVINGQDVWFRVHVGPLSDVAEIRNMRLRLIENDMDFILLRIGGAQAQAN